MRQYEAPHPNPYDPNPRDIGEPELCMICDRPERDCICTEETLETEFMRAGSFRNQPTGEHMRKPKHKRTPIPLLALQMAIFQTYPTQQHKTAVANLRASLADRLYRASQPKTRERI